MKILSPNISLTFVLLFLMVSLVVLSEPKDGFTQRDRENLTTIQNNMIGSEKSIVRLETRLDNLEKNIDLQRAESKDQNADDRTFQYWAFGIVISILFAFSGMIIWDRRSVLTPVESDNKRLKEKQEHIERIFTILAQTNPNIAEELKKLQSIH